MFLEYDIDGDGRLDRAEFIMLLKRISPKARAPGELHLIRDLIARERLQKHIGEMRLHSEGTHAPPARPTHLRAPPTCAAGASRRVRAPSMARNALMSMGPP